MIKDRKKKGLILMLFVAEAGMRMLHHVCSIQEADRYRVIFIHIYADHDDFMCLDLLICRESVVMTAAIMSICVSDSITCFCLMALVVAH